MADARGAWNETGEKLTELGRKLKVHYETQHDTEGQQARQELADAARRMGGAVQDAFEAIGTAARDKQVQQDVKQVGHSLIGALGATLGSASEEVRRALAERKGEATAEPPAAPAAGAPPAAPAVPEPPVAAEPPATAAPPASSAPGTPPPGAPPAGTGPADGPRVEPWGTP
jgi:hypothetical protein